MSVSIGSFSASLLQAQPFGYAEKETERGRTARAWNIEGLVLRTAWADLLSEYEDWQAAKFAEDDPVETGVVGATVLFSGTAEGISWTNVPCWFTSTPAAENAGPNYVKVSCTVVDAAQQLAIDLLDQESDDGDPDQDYGTYILGGVTLTLLQDPFGYEDAPSPQLAATSGDEMVGPRTARRILDIRGWTASAGAWATIRAWYEGEAAATPAAGDYFPVSLGRLERDRKVIAGVPTDRYIISCKLRQVLPLDARAFVACNLGTLKQGGSIAEPPVQDSWLVTASGQLKFAGIITPAIGEECILSYEHDGLLTRFPRRLYVLSSIADPVRCETTVNVGCKLTYGKDIEMPTILNTDDPPSWWVALPENMKKEVAPPIRASTIRDAIFDVMGLTLAANTQLLKRSYLQDEIDLSGKAFDLLSRLLSSEGCYGHTTPSGAIKIEDWNLDRSSGGPVYELEDLIDITPLATGEKPRSAVIVETDSAVADPLAGDPADGSITPAPSAGLLAELGDDLGLGAPLAGPFGPGEKLAGTGTIGNIVDSPTSTTDPADLEPESKENAQRAWEYEESEGFPTVVIVPYGKATGGSRLEARYSYTPLSFTVTEYAVFPYTDESGLFPIEKTKDVVIRRFTVDSSCLAATNPNYISSSLDTTGTAPGGSLALSIAETTYAYLPTSEGPILVSERQRQWVDCPSFSGAAGIDDYTAGSAPPVLVDPNNITIYQPEEFNYAGGTVVLKSEIVLNYEWNKPADMTKTVTTSLSCWGVTQEGQQQMAKSAELVTEASDILDLLSEATILVSDGMSVRTNIGRGIIDPPSRPTVAQREKERITVGAAPPRVEVESSIGEADPSGAIEDVLQLPLSPDDYLVGEAVDSETLALYRVDGGAKESAEAYGKMVLSAELGQANGLALTMPPWKFPSYPVSPITVRAGGLAAEYRTNATVWSIEPGKITVSTQALLSGITGTYTDPNPEQWLPSPAPFLSMPAAPAVTTNPSPAPANSSAFTRTPGDYSAPVFGSPPTDGADVHKKTQGSTTTYLPAFRLSLRLRLQSGSGVVIGNPRPAPPAALTLISGHELVIGEPTEDAGPPAPLAATYTQSGVYASLIAATQANMQNGNLAETEATGTEDGYQDWIQMDFGTPTPVTHVAVSADSTSVLGGGEWGPQYLQGSRIQTSNDGTTWTDRWGFGYEPAAGLLEIPIGPVTVQYVRLYAEGNYIAVTELYCYFDAGYSAPAALNSDAIPGTYSQSAVYGSYGIVAATQANMQNGSPFERFATFTEYTGSYIQIDFGSVTSFSKVVLAEDVGWMMGDSGDFGTTYLDGTEFVVSNSSSGPWTVIYSGIAFSPDEIQGLFDVGSQSAQFLRVRQAGGGYGALCVTEFYAKP
jgi:hypothetical protein